MQELQEWTRTEAGECEPLAHARPQSLTSF
jgi:hypothetical protein